MPAFGKRRALGQHFLKDHAVVARIVDETLAQFREHGCRGLLEIGPGRGALTEPLAEALRRDRPASLAAWTLSERDHALEHYWRERLPSLPPGTQIQGGDFLDLDPASWLAEGPLGVVSNLPYSAGTAIVLRLAQHPTRIPFMVLMFQAEVAERLRAQPGTKAWGSLSIWIQNRWDVRKLCAVPPRAFKPPPDVQSEVVVLTARANARVAVDPARESTWEKLLKTSFAHRRKMLRSGLPAGSAYARALLQSGIDGTKRAEALTWDEWNSLYRALISSE